MFNLDNIEFDFDDDFSCNIFSKKITSDKGDAVTKGRACENRKPNEDSLKTGLTLSPHQVLQGKSCRETATDSPMEKPKENTLKRSHLEDEKPHKKRLSHETLLPRRFPGPAGLLPDKPFNRITEFPFPVEKWTDEEEANAEKEKPIIYSQSSGSVFLESAYQKLVSDFGLNDSGSPLNKYTVKWVKKTALSKGLQGRKIPFLGLVVHAVDHSMPDPVLVLRDTTGEIRGSLHREVWAEMGGKLRAGIAVALRQVGVLITGVIRRQIYLNITMNNILAIYRPSENEKEVETIRVNKVSRSELVKSFGEWWATSRTAPEPPPEPPGPFTTIDDSCLAPAGKEESRRSREQVDGHREVLSDLGIELKDSDFSEEMTVPESGAAGGGRALSPAESLIFEEVLSGIDLDEFEL